MTLHWAEPLQLWGNIALYSYWHLLLFCVLQIMSQPAHLRVILSDHDVQKLTLPSGVPGTNFCLHYKDVDFGNDFFYPAFNFRYQRQRPNQGCVCPGTPDCNFDFNRYRQLLLKQWLSLSAFQWCVLICDLQWHIVCFFRIDFRKPNLSVKGLALGISNSPFLFQYRDTASVRQWKIQVFWDSSWYKRSCFNASRHSWKISWSHFWIHRIPIKCSLKSGSGGPDPKTSLPQRTRVIQWLLRLDSTTEIQDEQF